MFCAELELELVRNQQNKNITNPVLLLVMKAVC